MEWEISLNDLSNPGGWLDAGRSLAGDLLRRAEVTIDLPDVRMPSKVSLGGDGGIGVSFDDTGTLVIIAVVVIGAMLFLKGK